jgi:hypothetical protein
LKDGTGNRNSLLPTTHPEIPVSRKNELPPDCVYPFLLADLANVDRVTVWKWEQSKRLPARDFIVNGEPLGWKPGTVRPFLEERGALAA